MLPNVSAIYRDLTYLANPNLNKSSQHSIYSSPQQQAFNQKQARHNQLMEKLRNAQRQSSNINQQLRRVDAPCPSTSIRSSYSSFETSLSPQSYNINSNYYENERSSLSIRGWQPPNIRYRHIEDCKILQQQQTKVEPIPEIKAKQKLEREFYQNQVQQREVSKETIKNETIYNIKNQEVEGNMKADEFSETSYGRTWANRQSKFQQKLESYYQLCRKRPVSRKIESNQIDHTNRQKFTRGANNRPVGLELQKAMKLLSFD